MMTLVAAFLALTGCTPEEQAAITQMYEDMTPSSLAGTTWVCNTTETYEGVSAKIYSTIHFETETDGYFFISSVVDGETIEGGFNITYTYVKPKGILSYYVENVSLDMDFSVSYKTLKLTIQNGQKTRTYKLLEDDPNENNNLICTEWASVDNSDGSTDTKLICFLDNGKAVRLDSYIVGDPHEDDYVYNEMNYTVNGNTGFFDEEGVHYKFTIENNTRMIVEGNDGSQYTLSRRGTTPPKEMVGTSWTATTFDEYYYEDRDSYFESQSVFTFNFTTASSGNALLEYSVPELSYLELDETYTVNFTYTYNNARGTINLNAYGETVTSRFVALSDLLIFFEEDGSPVFCTKNYKK